MAENYPQSFNNSTFPSDVSEETVTAALLQRNQPLFLRKSVERWRVFQKIYSNKARYIEAISYEAAPDDPLARELISAALMDYDAMLNRSRNSEDIGSEWERFGTEIFLSVENVQPPEAA